MKMNHLKDNEKSVYYDLFLASLQGTLLQVLSPRIGPVGSESSDMLVFSSLCRPLHTSPHWPGIPNQAQRFSP